MKSLLVQEGDLVLGPGGFTTISGPGKVRQDLGIAAREPFGCDRFHVKWGSTLPDYVGQPATDEVRLRIQAEINRLVSNYVAAQAEAMSRDASQGRKPRFSSGEVVAGVDSLRITQEGDRYYVRVGIRTLSGEEVVLATTVRTA